MTGSLRTLIAYGLRLPTGGDSYCQGQVNGMQRGRKAAKPTPKKVNRSPATRRRPKLRAEGPSVNARLRAHLAAIVDSSGDAIIGKTLDGVITSWNQSAERIFGYLAKEAIGQSMVMLMPPGREDEEKGILRRIARGESVPFFETQRMHKTGALVDVSVCISPIKDGKGRVIGASKIARDITHQKQSEREIARISRLYSALGDVNQAIARSQNRTGLYEAICRALVEQGKFLMCWIGIHDPESKRIVPAAECGDLSGYLHKISVYSDKRPEGLGPTGTAFRDDTHVVCNDLAVAEIMGPWRREFTKRGIRSSAALPIRLKGKPCGVLTVYAKEVDFFKDKEIALLVEAADDISFALENLINEEDRQRAVDSLRESEERFRQIAENIEEVFWIADPGSNRMLYVSPAYARIWGLPNRDLYESNAPWLESIHPDDREKAGRCVLTARSKTGHDETYRIVRPDGAVRWIRERGIPVSNAQGEVYRFVGTAEDITTRRHHLARISEQASLLDAAHEAISVRDLDGRITYWNKGAERTFGWLADEVMGRKISDVFQYSADRLQPANEKVLVEGTWEGEVESRRKDGQRIDLLVRWTLVRDEDGKPKAILAINTDITEKKDLEAQFLRAQRLESVGTLAGGIAHDLNNLLAPIMMGIELLKITTSEQRRLEVIRTIETSVRRGAELVKQVLSFSRGLEGALVTLNVGYTVREVASMIQNAFPKNISININLPQDLWMVSADPTKLNQVLMNLCVNARDAMPDGGRLELGAGNIEIDKQYAITDGVPLGRYVQIHVRDSGSGMTKEVMERVFEPFFTTKEVGKGTGLGLSTVAGIVRGLGGFVRIESALGRGSIFKVYLPAVDNESLVSAADTATGALPRGNGELILVVDDEESVLEITRQTLEGFGYRSLLADNGAHAISTYAMHQDEVAAVVTDMMMPVMDGAAVIKALLHLNPNLPIIATSGRNTGLGAEPIAGIKRFIAKPFSASELLEALKEALAPGVK